MNDVAVCIKQFNAGRDPDRLAMKMQKMRTDPFIFLRGACHLFYAQLPHDDIFVKAPVTWVCGDLHLENFGSFKGDNRLAYFDINDFDEAVLAPNTWDMVRFLASLQLGVRSLSVSDAEVDVLGATFVDAYAAALAGGKARWVERETAQGLVRDLLQGLATRSRAKFLDSRTEIKGKHRKIRLDGKKALAVDDERRDRVETFLRKFAETQENPEFFRVLDVARRIAGTGSLGVERDIILIEGEGSPDENFLLDLKRALPSSLAAHLTIPQPAWTSEAARVVSLQQRMQAIPMAFLHPVEIAGNPYILRGLLPSEDRVALENWKGKLHRLQDVMTSMGRITAWGQLRSGGRNGSAIADELIEFGLRTDWRQPLLDAAKHCTNQVVADWRKFSEAYDQGFFK